MTVIEFYVVAFHLKYFQGNNMIRPQGYKTFFVFSSAKHEISTAHKTKMLKTLIFFAFKLSDLVFIMLLNFKMPTIVGILTFMSRINFVLS